MKNAAPILVAALLLGTVLYFVLAKDETPVQDTSANANTTPAPREQPEPSPDPVKDNAAAANPSPKSDSGTINSPTETSQPVETANSNKPTETKPEPIVEVKETPAEKIEEPTAPVAEETPVEETPAETPQRKSAGMMLEGLTKWMNAADYCEVPFSIDGIKEVATISEVQELFDKASKKAIKEKVEITIKDFASHDPETVMESGPEELKKYLSNTRFAKMIDQAKKAGGHVGYMVFTRKMGTKESDAELILAFNKEGKIVGFAD